MNPKRGQDMKLRSHCIIINLNILSSSLLRPFRCYPFYIKTTFYFCFLFFQIKKIIFGFLRKIQFIRMDFSILCSAGIFSFINKELRDSSICIDSFHP